MELVNEIALGAKVNGFINDNIERPDKGSPEFEQRNCIIVLLLLDSELHFQRNC